jgi:hypothetical protein
MWGKSKGLSRKDRRGGSGRDVDETHFDEVLGSLEFFVYVAPNTKPKGYETLRTFLESAGCSVVYPAEAPLSPGERYQAVKVTYQGLIVPARALRRIHKWAHQRNFLHSFFRPLTSSGGGYKAGQ